MSNRKWLPTDYQDEAIPPPLPSPNDWIGQLSDGRFFLKSPDPLDRGDVCGRLDPYPWITDIGDIN